MVLLSPFLRTLSGTPDVLWKLESSLLADCVESRAEAYEKLPGAAPRDSTATAFLLADHVL